MKTNKTYQIGEISERLGISSRTIRYYEELRLIESLRTEGGFRLYDQFQVERLQTILALKDLGMSLDEIGKLLCLRKGSGDNGDATSRLLNNLREKKDEFKKKIKKYEKGINELDQVIRMLEHCKCCEKPLNECESQKCMEEHGEAVSPFAKTLL